MSGKRFSTFALAVSQCSKYAGRNARLVKGDNRGPLNPVVDAVYQGAFAGHGWVGYADILRRVPTPAGSHSAFGDFHYECMTRNSPRETRGGTILQLALYADLLGQVQGLVPDRFFVVAPGAPFAIHEYRIADYAAYIRLVRRRMLEAWPVVRMRCWLAVILNRSSIATSAAGGAL